MGKRAEKKQPFVRGRRTSTGALLTIDRIVAGTVVEGSMTKATFLHYLEFVLVRFYWFLWAYTLIVYSRCQNALLTQDRSVYSS